MRHAAAIQGDTVMDQRLQGLCSSGYQLVWAAGSYCRACRDEREVLLRWDGDCWVEA